MPARVSSSSRTLGLGLGVVAGDDLGDRPVVAVGDQYAFVEDLLLECVAGGLVEVEGQAVFGGGIAGELVADHAGGPGVVEDLRDLGFDLVAGSAGVAPGQGVAQRAEFPGGLGQGLVEAPVLGRCAGSRSG
ncbi:MAG: hypothetical protein M3Z25_06275 [Actinomycetota bacterium]|nr:hypothetical protein [Actinomycetota bacterium]